MLLVRCVDQDYWYAHLEVPNLDALFSFSSLFFLSRNSSLNAESSLSSDGRSHWRRRLRGPALLPPPPPSVVERLLSPRRRPPRFPKGNFDERVKYSWVF